MRRLRRITRGRPPTNPLSSLLSDMDFTVLHTRHAKIKMPHRSNRAENSITRCGATVCTVTRCDATVCTVTRCGATVYTGVCDRKLLRACIIRTWLYAYVRACVCVCVCVCKIFHGEHCVLCKVATGSMTEKIFRAPVVRTVIASFSQATANASWCGDSIKATTVRGSR